MKSRLDVVLVYWLDPEGGPSDGSWVEVDELERWAVVNPAEQPCFTIGALIHTAKTHIVIAGSGHGPPDAAALDHKLKIPRSAILSMETLCTIDWPPTGKCARTNHVRH